MQTEITSPHTFNPEVKKLVDDILGQHPDLKPSQIKPFAERLDPTVKSLSTKSFHGKYTLRFFFNKGVSDGTYGEARKKAARRKRAVQARRSSQKGKIEVTTSTPVTPVVSRGDAVREILANLVHDVRSTTLAQTIKAIDNRANEILAL